MGALDRSDGEENDDTGRRARVIRWMAWFVVPWSLAIGSGMAMLGEPGASVSLFSVSAGCLAAIVLVGRSAVTAAGHVLVFSLMQCLWTLSVLLGGVSSPPTQWWVLGPVMATAAGGIRAGLIWAGVMCVGAVALHVVQTIGGVDAPYLVLPGWDLMGTVTGIGLLVLMAGYLWANDQQYQRVMEKLRAARASEREANQAKSVFLANMSHELRTPLNAILGYAELVAEEAAEEGLPGMVEDLERVQRAGRHLLGLVDDVLDLSKIEAGRMELTLESVDLADVVAEAVDEVRPLAEGRGNTLIVDLPRGTTVRADRFRLRQCLLNVLSNAAKFTENGRIEVAGGSGEVQVRDTGIGMTPDQLQRVFEPFTQAEAATHRTYGGTGLGLAIVRRLMDQMGGVVELQSALGVGTTVTLRIPFETR